MDGTPRSSTQPCPPSSLWHAEEGRINELIRLTGLQTSLLGLDGPSSLVVV